MKLVKIIVAQLLFIALAACGGAETTWDGNEEFDAQEQVDVAQTKSAVLSGERVYAGTGCSTADTSYCWTHTVNRVSCTCGQPRFVSNVPQPGTIYATCEFTHHGWYDRIYCP